MAAEFCKRLGRLQICATFKGCCVSQAGAILERAMSGEPDAMDQLAGRLAAGAVVRRDEPLAKRTTLRVGGSADLYVEPASEDELAAVIRFCGERELPWFVLGRGSNLLVKDGGFRGVVISLAQPYFSRIEIDSPRLRCGAGAKLKAVAVEAKRNGLAGLEFLEGIPGSVGGGLRMNAGAMGGAMFEAVESVRVMDSGGNIHDREARELSVTYRSCGTLKTHAALSAVLRGRPDSGEEIARRMNEYSRKRWQSQPAAPSAGCIFKNPASIPAGKLIEELGLKGRRVGGASISLEHGNFIVTDGKATARDVLDLIGIIRDRARAERGIELETEVQIIGE
jgi:UDP-N-acetylenolpyruvoylglucosamine reductase